MWNPLRQVFKTANVPPAFTFFSFRTFTIRQRVVIINRQLRNEHRREITTSIQLNGQTWQVENIGRTGKETFRSMRNGL